METMQGALKNGRNMWDRVNMPQVEFDSRVARVREAMKRDRIDLLLIYGHDFDRYGDTAYLTNFLNRSARGTLVALSASGRPILFIDASSRDIPSFTDSVSDAEIVGASDMVKNTVTSLREKNLLRGRVGMEGFREYMPQVQFLALREALADCEIVESRGIIAELRLVKSGREQDQIRRAGRLVKEVFEALPTFAFPSLEEHVIQAFLFREARYEGAEDVRLLVGRADGKGWHLRPAAKEVVTEGERVSVYLAVELERYWAAKAGTFRLEGGLLVPFAHPFDDLYSEIGARLKAGVTAEGIRASTVETLKKGGIEPVAGYPLAKGIGLAPEEPPFVGMEDSATLKEGMTATLHLVVKEEAGGVLMKGDTLLVTGAAPVSLT